MATFLVAHGAWSAGWAWKKMHPRLRAAGHTLVVPTYTGLGERAHLAHPGIDLDTHIADVLGVVEYEDLRDVVLIGHSYGGMVATGVADRARDRVAQLIYLDAFAPDNGKCLLDYLADDVGKTMRRLASEQGEGWRIPPNPMPPDTPAEDVAWALPRRVPMPLKCFTTPLRLEGTQPPPPRSYIYCTRISPGDPFGQFARRAQQEPGWRYEAIDASHNPHITMPDRLAALLSDIAGGAVAA